MSDTANVSAQNNVVTAAEYQAAADEITAILAAQRADRAPVEAELDLLQNRADLLFQRQQQALNTLRAAEADPTDTVFLEQSRLAYARATGEVNTVNTAIQQTRSVLAQSLQSSAELQDQRTNLEVKADFAERSPPPLNSLTPPATTIAGQSATYVAPPAPPIPPAISPPLLTDAELLQIYPETDPQEVGALRGTTIITDEARRIMSDPAVIQQQLAINATSVAPVPPTATARALSDQEASQLFEAIDNPPAATNNQTTAAEYQAAADEITAIINAQRAERAPIEAEQELLRNRQELLITRQQAALNTLQAAEADPTNTEFLEASRTAYARVTGEVNATSLAIQQNRSVLAQSRQSTAELQDQRNNLEVKADFADRSPPAFNSLTPPATVVPDQEATYYPPPDDPIPPVMSPIASDGDEALDAFDAALLAQQEGRAFAQSPFVSSDGDEALAAFDEALLAQQEGRAFAQSPFVSSDGDEALAAFDAALLAQQEGRAFAQSTSVPADGDEALAAFEQAQFIQGEADAFSARNVNDPLYGLSPQQIAALGSADPTDPYIRARLGIPQLPGSQLAATPGFGTIKTGVPLIDSALSALSSLTGLFGGPPKTQPAAVNPAVAGPTAPPAEPINGLDIAPGVPDINGLDLPPDPPAENNVTTSAEYQAAADEVAEIQAAARAESTQLASQLEQDTAALEASTRRANELQAELRDTQAAGASEAEIASLSAAYDAEVENSNALFIQQQTAQAAFEANQQYRADLNAQENYLAVQAAAAASGPPGLNSVPGLSDDPAQLVEVEPPTIPDSFATFTPISDDEALQALQDAEDNALAAQEGRAFPPVDAPLDPAATGDAALQAIEDAEAAALGTQEGGAFAEPTEVPASGDEALQAVQDAEDRLLAEQEGRAFPPVEDPAAVPASGDEALQAIEDAEAATLARNEGVAFSEPLDVPASGDEALQAIEDAELAAQEGLAFPPIENPAPVAGDEALQAIEDAQAAELARAEGVAFAEPLDVPASGDEALQAIEDAELAAQEGSAFALAPEPVGDEALAATQEAELAALREAEANAVFGPAPVSTEGDEALAATERAQQEQATGAVNFDTVNPDAEEAAAEAAARQKAREQATLQARYKQPSTPDWRVRLVLAQGSTYLYNADPPGVLAPLARSNGVIFPYTPQISTSYQAQYDQYDLIHSNFRGVFYKNSKVNDIQIRGTFTAQDTTEANYLLAVIHFFRSVTKMFYGQDAERGTPPPLVYLVGYGDLQFSGHPCLVSTFNYTLPNDVDYIRALAPNNYGQNLLGRRAAPLSAPSPSAGQQARQAILQSAGISPGAVPRQLVPSNVVQNVNNTERATYVPTKMEIDITLIPVNTRNQISKSFSFKEFANGDLLKRGYW